MVHPPDCIRRALTLHEEGVSTARIADLVAVPRSTVRDWIAGRLPRTAGPEGGPQCSRCGGRAHLLDRLPLVYAYLLGIYLGDGCISAHPRGVYKLRLTLDARYPRIADEVAAAVAAVMPANRVNRRTRPDNSLEIYSYSKSWPCLFPQHGPGKKHAREIACGRRLNTPHSAPVEK